MSEGDAVDPVPLPSELLHRWKTEWRVLKGDVPVGMFGTVTLVAQRLWDVVQLRRTGQDPAAARLELSDAVVGLAPLAHTIEDIHAVLGLLGRLVVEEPSLLGSGPIVLTTVIEATAVAASRYVAELEHTADLDSMTSLRRRDTFERDLREAVNDARESGDQVTLAIVDLDDLKKLNEEKGYSAGDAALTLLARALTDSTKPGDTTYRWGGDEFPTIFKRTTRAAAEAALQRIEDAGAPAFSRGVATFPDDADNRTELWLAAEFRLKANKRDRKAVTTSPDSIGRLEGG